MWPVIAWQNRLLAAALAGALVVGGVWAWGAWNYRAGLADGRAALVAEMAEQAEAIRRALRDADTGHGDPDDDLCWLSGRMRVDAPPGCP